MISTERAARIVELYTTGHSYKQIYRLVGGVSGSQVGRILRAAGVTIRHRRKPVHRAPGIQIRRSTATAESLRDGIGEFRAMLEAKYQRDHGGAEHFEEWRMGAA